MKHWNETGAMLASVGELSSAGLRVRHIDIPATPEKVWRILHEHGVAHQEDRNGKA